MKDITITYSLKLPVPGVQYSNEAVEASAICDIALETPQEVMDKLKDIVQHNMAYLEKQKERK